MGKSGSSIRRSRRPGAGRRAGASESLGAEGRGRELGVSLGEGPGVRATGVGPRAVRADDRDHARRWELKANIPKRLRAIEGLVQPFAAQG